MDWELNNEKKDMVPSNSMLDLLKSARKKHDEYKKQYKEMEEQYKGIILDIEAELHDILGLYVMSSVTEEGIYFYTYIKGVLDMYRVVQVLEKYDFKCELKHEGSAVLKFIVKGV